MDDLPLFNGPHIAAIRFDQALSVFDFATAIEAAEPQWVPTLEAMADCLERAGSPARIDLDELDRCRRAGWPDPMERTWHRLAGLALDGRGIPGLHHGEPAAAFLLRGGEPARAHRSALRHLEYHPRDTRTWELVSRFEPQRAAARCGFHGGPLLDCAGELLDCIADDEVAPPERWLLAYAWFQHQIDLEEVERALAAEQLLITAPLPVPGDAHAFARYLLDAGGVRFDGESVGVIEARRRLRDISPIAFQRYLRRV